jgi:thioredoxin 1
MSSAAFIQTETEFDSLLTTAPLLVVDCTATWCGPCKLVSPLIDQLAVEYRDRATVCKLDLDVNPAMARRFNVRSIPAVLVFRQGDLAEILVGVKPYQDFSAAVERHLAMLNVCA